MCLWHTYAVAIDIWLTIDLAKQNFITYLFMETQNTFHVFHCWECGKKNALLKGYIRWIDICHINLKRREQTTKMSINEWGARRRKMQVKKKTIDALTHKSTCNADPNINCQSNCYLTSDINWMRYDFYCRNCLIV